MASYQPSRFTRPLLAATDFSANQYKYVKGDANDEMSLAGGAAGAIGAGFLHNAPGAGQMGEIASIGGGALAIASATVSGPNIKLKALATGLLTPATTAGDVIVAISKEAAAANDVFEVEPVLFTEPA